jgi:Ser/Thr protein kinase RdoA (MazF antagonist)
MTDEAQTDLDQVLKEYDIGVVTGLAMAGGTAGRTWKIAASTGDYFLRLRGVRTSGEERLAFDHGLREHLVRRGVPTASAVRTRDGDRWVRRLGRAFELYPFVVGRPFRPDSMEEIVAAAEALARFHAAAADYRPPSHEPERLAQYTTLGFSTRTSVRMDDPELQRLNMAGVRDLANTREEVRLMGWCLERADRLSRTYSGEAYQALARWVIHGDYTPANLLFSADGQVVGIFDLDWAVPGTRCRDIAEGLYFFGSEPRDIDSSNIWSLTEAADSCLERCVTFLAAYSKALPLRPEEIDAIPRAFEGLWFSNRLEGMAKVPAEDRFRFFARDIRKPVLWLDANWSELKESAR